MAANDEHKYGDGRFCTGPETPPRLPPRPHRAQRPLLNNNSIHGGSGAARVPPPVPPFPAPALERQPQTRRTQNLYVDTPRRAETAAVHKPAHKQATAVLTRDNTITTSVAAAPVISRQPLAATDPLKHQLIHEAPQHQDSVICLKCRKCTCSSCKDPRRLPSRWVCGQNVSLDSAVEVCTCYCCVKGLFYHMFKDAEMDDDHPGESDPCSCQRGHCCQRWGCIGVMAVCLPCLCCFPPLKGLVNVITTCYNRCNRRGCTCPRQRRPSPQRRPSQTKRGLLDSSDGSSS